MADCCCGLIPTASARRGIDDRTADEGYPDSGGGVAQPNRYGDVEA
jgi:hypothetical protein